MIYIVFFETTLHFGYTTSSTKYIIDLQSRKLIVNVLQLHIANIDINPTTAAILIDQIYGRGPMHVERSHVTHVIYRFFVLPIHVLLHVSPSLKMLEAKLAEAGNLKILLDGKSLAHINTHFSPI